MSKSIVITESQYKRIFLSEQSDFIDSIKLDALEIRSSNKIDWRPQGYRQEDLNDEIKRRKDLFYKEIQGCEWVRAPTGGGCYFCGKNNSKFCGDNPQDVMKSHTNIMGGAGKLFNGGSGAAEGAIINNSILLFNEALTHKRKIMKLFGWTGKNEEAPASFYGSNMNQNLKGVPLEKLINPETIVTSYYGHLKTVSSVGDEEKEALESDQLSRQSGADRAYNKEYSKWADYGKDLDKEVKFAKSIPGWTSPDWGGGSWDHVPNVLAKKQEFQKSSAPKRKTISRELSEMEQISKDYIKIITYINDHNRDILNQTESLYNKTKCGVNNNKKYYTTPNGEVYSKTNPDHQAQTYLTPHTSEVPSKKELCGSIWIYPSGENTNKFTCGCSDHTKNTQQLMYSDGRTLSVASLGRDIDIRSKWDQFTSKLTLHTVLQTTSAVVVWFFPYGTALSAGLEVIDGLIYLNEGEEFAGGVTLALALVPASRIFRLLRSGGKESMSKIVNLVNGSSNIVNETTRLQNIIDGVSNFTLKEQKIFYQMMTKKGISEVNQVNRVLTALKPKTEAEKLIYLARTAPAITKSIEKTVQKTIFRDMTKKQKALYSGILAGTAPLTMSDDDGVIPKKTEEDEMKKMAEESEGYRVICNPKKGEIRTCQNCEYVDCSENKDYAVNYNYVLNKEFTDSGGNNESARALLDSW